MNGIYVGASAGSEGTYYLSDAAQVGNDQYSYATFYVGGSGTGRLR